jgi:hypothetical protein
MVIRPGTGCTAGRKLRDGEGGSAWLPSRESGAFVVKDAGTWGRVFVPTTAMPPGFFSARTIVRATARRRPSPRQAGLQLHSGNANPWYLARYLASPQVSAVWLLICVLRTTPNAAVRCHRCLVRVWTPPSDHCRRWRVPSGWRWRESEIGASRNDTAAAGK